MGVDKSITVAVGYACASDAKTYYHSTLAAWCIAVQQPYLLEIQRPRQRELKHQSRVRRETY